MRPQRVLRDGATYHVTSQIDHGAMALEGAEIEQMFLDFIEKGKKKFHFKLWNFVVTGNHIQFFIKPGKNVSLSEIMQWMKCNFAKKWNKEHNTSGHLWGERFFSRIIRDKREFAGTAGTLVNGNPVKAKPVRKAKAQEPV
jgi:putative transposase